jgi:hypothetical protein
VKQISSRVAHREKASTITSRPTPTGNVHKNEYN